MRPASPTHSVSSLIGFTFETSNSVTAATSTSISSAVKTTRANFWDFEAYSRSFLHEKKLIEKEKEEWERRVEDRRIILRKSIDFYAEKYEKLAEEAKECSRQISNLKTKEATVKEIEKEIEIATDRVEKIKKLLKYFQSLYAILKNSDEAIETEFKEDLMKQDWKVALEKLVLLSGDGNEDSDHHEDNKNSFKLNVLSKRLEMFYGVLDKKIKTFIDGLGWPKIVSNEETAEIISSLQELLTYGEALYILASRNLLESFDHPIKNFIDPIKIRFDYHFNSDRPTNQLNRPEWYFDHLISLCREILNFFREFILPCWRLRDLDDFIRDGIIDLAIGKTVLNLKSIGKEDQNLRIHYVIEMGKFLKTLQDEFGYGEVDGIIEKVFIENNAEEFIELELKRVQEGYSKLFQPRDQDQDQNDQDDDWITRDSKLGEPSPAVLKFLSFFHSSTILPYSFIKKDMKLRARLLVKIQSWLLETFHDKCQFDCSPLHTSPENALKDVIMINSLGLLCKVLRDDFGESLDYVELSSSGELLNLIGYDPSVLPGTCFNRAIEAFKAISDKLNSYVFNYAMNKFLNYATAHSNAMIYARIEADNSGVSENLRLAVKSLLEAVEFIKKTLNEQEFKKLFNQILPQKLATFMFQGVLLKNFFTEPGARQFQQDLLFITDSLNHVIDPSNLKSAFEKVQEATEILKIKEKDATAPFDGIRLAKSIKEHRSEELKRFLEMQRFTHVTVEELGQIFASRRH